MRMTGDPRKIASATNRKSKAEGPGDFEDHANHGERLAPCAVCRVPAKEPSSVMRPEIVWGLAVLTE